MVIIFVKKAQSQSAIKRPLNSNNRIGESEKIPHPPVQHIMVLLIFAFNIESNHKSCNNIIANRFGTNAISYKPLSHEKTLT